MRCAFDDSDPEWCHQLNSFGSERRNFESDIHMLILTGLDAGIANLNAEAEKRENELRLHFDSSNEAVRERLADEMSDVWGYLADPGALSSQHRSRGPLVSPHACTKQDGR
jgi:hypothetical protein